MRSSLPLGKSSLLSSLVLAATLTLSGCSSPVSEAELVARASEAIANGDLAAAELDVKTALQQNPENAAARSLYGQIYLRQINPGAAIGEFERSLGAADIPETRLALAKALVQAGESAELLSEYEIGAYASTADMPEFKAALARAYLAQAQVDEARSALAAADAAEANDYVDLTRAVFTLQLDKDSYKAKELLQSIVNRSPANAEAWSLLGFLATREDDRAAAEEYFAKASAANPYRLGDRLQLVTTQIRLGKAEDADKDLAQLEKLIPNYPEVNFLRGQLYFDDGDYKNAIDAFSQVLTANPNHAGALLLSANANVREQNLATAQRQYTQFLTLQPGHLPASLQLANLSWQLGDASKTEELARNILKEHEMNIPALGLLAMALSAQGLHAESAQAYQQIATLNPESTQAKVALGSQQMVAGDTEAGIEQLQAAVALDPSNAQARERLIEAHLAVGDLDAAAAAGEAYLEAAPDTARSAVYLGRVRLQQEDYKGARELFEKALTLEPGNVSASGGMAALAVLNKDLDGAKAAFEQALEANPGDVLTSMNLAVVLEQTGDLQAMQAVLSAAMEANPGAVAPRLALARYALSQNDADQAITLMAPVEENGEGDYQVHQILAGARLAVGNAEAARDNARRLLELRSNDPVALALVARVEAANGRPEQAQRHIDAALKLQPQSSELRKMLVESLIQQQKLEQAGEEIAKLPEEVQNETAVLTVRGRLAVAVQDFASAKTLFAKAFEQQRNNINLGLLTGARWALGERSETITMLEEWLEEYPDDLLSLNELASRQIEMGNDEAATSLYSRIVNKQPENVLALNNLAWLTRVSDKDAALDYISRADKLAPETAQIKDTYAMVELERGSYERALSLNAKALDAAKGSAELRYNRAQILSRAGRIDEARAVLEELVSGPAFASQDAAKNLLNSL
ncbi:putative PEP-CTERM system TPR-repeat lipoprotein [gamma proteobacterium NOR5-3]|nr:putative PEP-CTERM system TPR-repeat lipoprotein [gamma proteobacterium NOR5-3]